MNTIILSPATDLIEEIANRLEPDGKDYSSQMVVFPGKRPAHFLRKLLAKKEKTGFIPPKIFSMDDFIDFVYEQVLGNRHKKLEILDAVAILYQIHIQSPVRLGGDNFFQPDFFFPLGLKVYHDLEELYIEQVTPEAVGKIDHILEESIPPQTMEKLQLISYFYQAFYQKLKTDCYSTRSLRYVSVAQEDIGQRLAGFEKIVFAGFFALTKAEQSIFKNLLSDDRSLFLFQDGAGLKENLRAVGVDIKPQPISSEPEIYFYKSLDTHGQVYGVSSILQEKIGRNTLCTEQTVIVVPSPDTIFPLYNHTLPLLNADDYNISLGYPLQRTPLFGFLNNLMQLITSMDEMRFFVPDYLSFILHPYTKNIRLNGRVDITRMLFHALEESLAGNRTKKFLPLAEIENDKALAEYMEKILQTEPFLTLEILQQHVRTIHQNTIGKMLSFSSIGDFAQKVSEVLTYIYENSTAPLHPFFYPYLEAFQTHLDIISLSLMKDVRFEGISSYFTLFRKYIMTRRTPFEGTPVRGLQVLGALETRNLRFENVIFLDTNEDVIPNAKKEDSILPFKARRILGLPTYTDQEKIAAYYFETLIKGAREVHLFYIENSQKEKSRFVEKLCWEKQKREKKRDVKEYIQSIQYSIELKQTPPEIIHKTQDTIKFLQGFSYSATSLNTYLKCPLKFYYQYVLALKKKGTAIETGGIRIDVGNFVHQALYEYFKGKKGRLLNENDMDIGELDVIVNKLFAEKYGHDLLTDTHLLKRQINRHLADFIKSYQIPQIKTRGVKIIDLEHSLELVQNSYRFQVKFDRIEKRNDRTTIIDYKTSSGANQLKINFDKLDINTRNSWGEAIGSLQLPVYLFCYAEKKKERPENIDCMFLLLGMTELDEKIEAPLFDNSDDIKEKYDLLQAVIWKLLEEITDPAFLFTPAATDKNSCTNCDFNYICGV